MTMEKTGSLPPIEEYIATLMDKVGGPFELTTIVQKRCRQLVLEEGRLEGFGTEELIERVLKELREGKISLQKAEGK